jgi:oligoribonuclease NrnB/cAMP/cGMP phosphodiesterase (DHH superfamily)
MRIVTRPDFDGIVCAALLYEVEKISHPTLWVQPSEMQKGLVPIEPDDIIANLPYHPACALWFDHHVTNQPTASVKGAFRVAPSAARVIYEYYEGRFKGDFETLVRQTDDIDSANLTDHQILYPERYPHVLLSMTITGHNEDQAPYWNHLVERLRHLPAEDVIMDPVVSPRCTETIERNAAYKDLLISHTHLERHVAITDFRALQPAPDGNRFLVYSLFSEASVSVKIRYSDPDSKNITVGVGRSVLNDTCVVNVGKMLANFGGGGHAGAGACTFPASEADQRIPQIIKILIENQRTEN